METMMTREPELPHKILASYILEETSPDELKQITRISKQFLEFELLFELIDKVKTQINDSNRVLPREPIEQDRVVIEELILRLFSGKFVLRDGEEFLQNLANSVSLYKRTLSNLETLSRDLEGRPVPEFAQVKMKPTGQLLDDLFKKADPDKTLKFIDTIKGWFYSVADALAPMPGPVLGGIIIALFIVLTIPYFFLKDDNLSGYVFDEQVPFPFRSQTIAVFDLRTSEDQPSIPTTLDSLLAQYKPAMRDYQLTNYEQVIDRLQNSKSLVRSLETQIDSDKYRQLIRDFYFYLGASYFAATRRENPKPDESLVSLHQEQAIENLLKAKEIAEVSSPEETEREKWLLALAYGFSGRTAEALKELQEIGFDSPYYDKSQKLIKRWSE